jgi:hypothetical protein
MRALASSVGRRPWRVAVALLLLVVVGAAVYLSFAWPELRVSYHRRRMQANYDAVSAGPSVQSGVLIGHDWGDAGEAYEYHRERLVELGAVTKLEHTFRHVMNTPGQHGTFWDEILGKRCPPLIDASSPGPTLPWVDDVQPLRLTVWCEHEHADAWRRHIAERDVPHDPPAATK